MAEDSLACGMTDFRRKSVTEEAGEISVAFGLLRQAGRATALEWRPRVGRVELNMLSDE